MEKSQKKAFDDNLNYLQENLILDETFYAGLIQHEIFTDDMIDIVKSKSTTNSRVMELVQLLKKRSSACFHDFIKLMKDTSQEHLAVNILKSLHSQNQSDRFPERERIKNFLVHHFSNSRKLTSTDTKLLESELVLYEDFILEREERLAAGEHNQRLLSEIHMKDTEIEELHVKLDCYTEDIEEYQAKLKQSEIDRLRCNSNPRAITRSTSETSDTSGRFSPDNELREIIKQKEQTIKRDGQEYEHLKSIMEKCQADNESLQELNSHYLMIISQLDDMQRNGTPNQAESSSVEYAEIEEKLEAAETQVAKLERDLEEANEWLIETQEDLEEVLARERKVKVKLGLTEDASERQVTQRIRELCEGGSGQKKELDSLRKELAQVKINRSRLEDKVTSLAREKEQVEFHMRQQDLLIKKLVRMKNAKETIDSASARIGGRQRSAAQISTISLSTLDMDKTQLKLKATGDVTQHYCILCRKDINHLHSVCWFHFRALRNGKWQCCRDECFHSAGCLRVSHFYIEFSADKRFFSPMESSIFLLTDVINRTMI